MDYSEYEKIEAVYMCFEKMSKQEIADLYKRDSQLVVNTLYNYVLDINKTNDKRNAKLDELQKSLDHCNEVADKMIADNGELRKCIDRLKHEKSVILAGSFNVFEIERRNEMRIEELETELHQYRTLFADIEKNMTVDLHKTLLGVTE